MSSFRAIRPVLLLGAALLLGELVAHADAAAEQPAAHPSGKLVLVAFSGDEAKLAAPYHHALLMKKSGKLEDVAIVVYGRAISALSTKAKGIPDPVRAAIHEARQAGIPIFACEHSLQVAGIAAEDLTPDAQRVPSGAVKIAELVSQGFVPMQY